MNIYVKSKFFYGRAKRTAHSIHREALRGRDTGANEFILEQIEDEASMLLVDVDFDKEFRLYRWLGQNSFDKAVEDCYKNVRKVRACARFVRELNTARRLTRGADSEVKYWTIKNFENDLSRL